MTPEETVERIARMTDPYNSSEPFDSEQTLARLVQECRSICALRGRNRSITLSLVFSIRPLPEFTEWLNGLSDSTVRGAVVARIKRLELGLMGDVVAVGEGVSELRIHIGAGWRVYFARRGALLIVLLAGGSKRTQPTDIKRAKSLAALLD